MSVVDLNATFIESLPTEILEIFPAAKPPPGITPNFNDPSTLFPAVLSTLIIFLFFAIASYAIRIYMKSILKKWRWDDTIITLSFIFTIFYLIGALISSVNGVVGVHLWEIHVDRALQSTVLWGGWIIAVAFIPALGFLKLCFLVQFYYLFKPLRWMRLACWIGGSLITFMYAGISIVAFVLQSPWPKEDLLSGILSWHYLAGMILTFPIGVLGVVADLFIFLLPIPAIMGLQLAFKRKIGILFVFALGLLAGFGSIVGLYYRVVLFENDNTDQADPGWNAAYIVVGTQIELLAGITAVNMHTVHQFFVHKNIIQRIQGRNFSSTIRSLLPYSGTNKKDSTLVQAESSRSAAQININMNSNTSDSIDWKCDPHSEAQIMIS